MGMRGKGGSWEGGDGGGLIYYLGGYIAGANQRFNLTVSQLIVCN